MSLSFHFVQNNDASTEDLKQCLLSNLGERKQVIWLVPGGSNIGLSVAVIQAIPVELRANLTIMQTDERYGVYDHKDSNWLQLRDAGFDATGANVITILTPDNLSLQDTSSRYSQLIEDNFREDTYIIGQFGIGPDGHIAGILPGTPGTISNENVVGYQSDTFTRITLSVKALLNIDIAFAFVFGESKFEALNRLSTESLTTSEQPSQLLKQLPEAHIYQDQINQ
ncbi:MAG: 6-phosphogluconolactonase [Candidatus Saccharimonadales bacterium]